MFSIDAPAGWSRSGESGKSHWFPAGTTISVCGKVTGGRGPRFQGDVNLHDPCGLCLKKKPPEKLPT